MWKEDVMEAEKNIIGITDEGMPIVLPQHCCEHWSSGNVPMFGSKECWYCRWADFRKSAEVTLEQSVCRCPENRVGVMWTGKNEGYFHSEK